MSPPPPRRREFPRAALGCAAAIVACLILVHRGDWRQFGAVFAALASAWKAPGRRWAYLSHWILPFLLSYATVLLTGIFFGLRRLKRGAR